MGLFADARWSLSQGVALVVAEQACEIMGVPRVLAHPSEEITQKTAKTMGIARASQWGFCKARLQVEVKRQAVQWVDGADKTGSNGVGNENPGVKPGEDESDGRRKASQLEVQELELEQQPAAGSIRMKSGNTGGTAGSRRGDTGGTAGSRTGDTRGTAGS